MVRPHRPLIPLAGTSRSRQSAVVDEMVFGRSELLKVFVSSEMRSRRLSEHRLAVADVVAAHPDAEPWLWERSANAGRYSSYDVCVGHARTSDLLLLILGDDLTDVTEAEWKAAKNAGANCALLLQRTDDRSQRATAFVARERPDAVTVDFDDVSGLRLVAASALRQCITDGVRRRAVARRLNNSVNSLSITPILEAGVDKAHDLYHSGSINDAAALVETLDQLTSGEERSDGLDLVSGLVHGARGHTTDAAAAYLRIIDNQSSSPLTVAVAHQNLGLISMKAGDLRLATREMKTAWKQHANLDNWFGVLQVLLNMGALSIEKSDLDTAAKLADLADDLIKEFTVPLPHQRASVTALRAHIAAREGRTLDALNGYRAVLRMARHQSDHDGEVVASQNVAAAYHDLGRTPLARRWATKALALLANDGHAWRREEIRRLLGLIELAAGDANAAVEHFEAAREIASAMDDDWRAVTLTVDIGGMLTEVDAERAGQELDTAYQQLTELGDVDWIARVEMNRAVLSSDAGQTDDAIAALERALKLRGVERSIRIRVLEHLANIEIGNGSVATAAKRLSAALKLADRDGPSTALTAGEYAHRLQLVGALKEARRFYDMGLRRAEAAGDLAASYDLRSDRALLLADSGDSAQALTELEAVLDIATRMRDRGRKVRALHNIGELARRTGDLARSLRALRRACTLAGDHLPEDHRSASGLLAITLLAADRPADASTTASALVVECEQAGDRANRSVALGVLGGVAMFQKRHKDAAALYRRAARLNADDPVHHLEDLCGILEAQAAAGRWGATQKAAQAVIDHAQKNEQQGGAWSSLLRASRWFIDRGAFARAAELIVPGWVLASQSASERRKSRGRELTDSAFFEAMLTTAFHELWSGHLPTDALYREILTRLDLDDGEHDMWEHIQWTRKVAAQTSSPQ